MHWENKPLNRNVYKIWIKSFSVGVFVGAGSRHEDLETSGSAYLLEKMFFRGTTSKSKSEIAESIDSIGAVQANTTGREISNFTL